MGWGGIWIAGKGKGSGKEDGAFYFIYLFIIFFK